MARIASAVVNKGTMPYTQYLLPKNSYSKKQVIGGGVRLMSTESAETLEKYMLGEAENQKNRQKPVGSVVLPSYVGGKTGTPERYRIEKDSLFYNRWSKEYERLYYHSKVGKKEKKWKSEPTKYNDGWYMFFVKGKDMRPLAVAVRMERCAGSGTAVRLTQSVILEALRKNGYINEK